MNFEKIKKYYIENKLISNCILLAILFFVNCFVGNFSYFVFFVLAVMVACADAKTSFSMLVFSIPFCAIDQYVSVILFFICILIFLIKAYIKLFFVDKKKPSLPVLIASLLFLIYAVLPFGEYNGQWAIKLLIIILLVLLLNLFINYTEILNLKFNLDLLAVALIISSAFYLTYYISPHLQETPIFSMSDTFVRFSALLLNPNVLAMVCEICLSLLTIFLLHGKFEWTEIISYVIFYVLGLSTFSKTFLILSSILVFIMFIYLLNKYKMKMIAPICIICGIIILAVIFKGDFVLTYLKRFIGGWNSSYSSYEYVLDIMTTGRYNLWTTVLDYMFVNPEVLFFGGGLGAPLIASLSAHNFYISLIYELGIVGALLFISMFVALIVEHKKKNNAKFYKAYLVPLANICMLMMVEDLFLYIY